MNQGNQFHQLPLSSPLSDEPGHSPQGAPEPDEEGAGADAGALGEDSTGAEAEVAGADSEAESELAGSDADSVALAEPDSVALEDAEPDADAEPDPVAVTDAEAGADPDALPELDGAALDEELPLEPEPESAAKPTAFCSKSKTV